VPARTVAFGMFKIPTGGTIGICFYNGQRFN